MTANQTDGGTDQTRLDSTLAGIARSGTFNLAGSGVAALSQFLVVLFAARLYDADEAGALFASTAVFVIVVALAQLGVDEALVRFIAAARAHGNHGDARRLLAIGLVPVIGTSAVAGGLLLAFAGPVAGLFATDQQPLVAQMLRVLALTVPLAALHDTMLAATRGYGRIRPTVVVERLVRSSLQPVAVLAVGLAGFGPDALAPAWAAPYLVGIVLSALALRRAAARPAAEPAEPAALALSPDPVGLEVEVPAGQSLSRSFWAFCSARALARVCQVALHRLDVILVAALVGTTEAAIYTGATRFIVLGQLVNLAISQVIQPRLAAMLARRERSAAETVVKRATIWLVALTWPGYLTLCVLGPWLMPVFGVGYESGAAVVAVLAVAMMIATATGPVDVVLLMEGRSGLSLANTAASLVVDVVGCLLLVPPFGILGAATAWAVAVVLRNGLSVLQTRRILDISAESRELGIVAGLACVCFAVIPVPLAVAGAPVAALVLVVGLGAVAYAVVLWRRRSANGLDAFAGMFRRRRAVTATGAAG